MYQLDFTKKALADIEYHKTNSTKALRIKISSLLKELIHHPQSGTGKPELLKYEYSGMWSRRLNREHRIIYMITEDTVTVLSAKGHYK
ncbi:MAG: Txe/YoeB family addiction module toxin [Candidatus Kapaibacteriales bacterium]